MKHPDHDIFRSDMAFISFGGAMLVGIGLSMLVIGILCSWLHWGLCGVELVSFPYLELVIRREFVSLNLPLGMLIIGIGLQLFNRLGWIVCLVIMGIFWVLFGLSTARLFPAFLVQGTDYLYAQEAVLNTALYVLISFSLIYMFTPSVRKLYFKDQADHD